MKCPGAYNLKKFIDTCGCGSRMDNDSNKYIPSYMWDWNDNCPSSCLSIPVDGGASLPFDTFL